MTARSLALVLPLRWPPAAPPPTTTLAAKNRPLESRCQVMKRDQSGAQPGQSRADVQAEAEAAQRRGELDKACGWL
jgi:hypothetical protein